MNPTEQLGHLGFFVWDFSWGNRFKKNPRPVWDLRNLVQKEAGHTRTRTSTRPRTRPEFLVSRFKLGFIQIFLARFRSCYRSWKTLILRSKIGTWYSNLNRLNHPSFLTQTICGFFSSSYITRAVVLLSQDHFWSLTKVCQKRSLVSNFGFVISISP